MRTLLSSSIMLQAKAMQKQTPATTGGTSNQGPGATF